MKLTKTSAHAVLAMAYLSTQSNNGLVQARQVADQLGIPTDSALKILQTLVRQGLIQSQLGRAGGYQLHRSAHDVTVLEVVEAMDGPIHAHMPINHAQEDLTCSLRKLRVVYEELADQIRRQLSRATVAELVRQDVKHLLSAS